jgi:hypothetical protein
MMQNTKIKKYREFKEQTLKKRRKYARIKNLNNTLLEKQEIKKPTNKQTSK